MLRATMVQARIVNDFEDLRSMYANINRYGTEKIELIKKIYSHRHGETIVVTLESDYGTVNFDMKKELCEYYKTKIITERLKEQFVKDCHNQKINFLVSEDLKKFKLI